MHYAFLSLLLAVSILDIFFYRGLSIAPMGLLYVALKMQADRAAELFLRQSLRPPEASAAPEPSWMPSPENDPFGVRQPISLSDRRREKRAQQERAPHSPSPEKSTNENPANAKIAPKASPPPKAAFRAPKFHGAPHEVLGIGVEANTAVIVKAFRHWIKEFHPDHLKPGQELRRATDRARVLTSAKESLLERRRQMRKAA